MPAERLWKEREYSRQNMVNCQLRPNGVGEARLIQAFQSVPMEAFVPPVIQTLVFCDANLPLTQDLPPSRWLLAPLTLGRLLQEADIRATDKVLVIGCGCGYSLALIAQLAAQVTGVESHEGLAGMARQYGAGYRVPNTQVVVGALSVGYPKDAPYDVILIEGAVEKVPSLLMHQLSSQGGRLVTVIRGQTAGGQSEFGKGVLITRTGEVITQAAKFEANCPYLPEFEPSAEFCL